MDDDINNNNNNNNDNKENGVIGPLCVYYLTLQLQL
jgi:hypothetical protein